MFIDFTEREREGRRRERDRHIDVRNIIQLPPIQIPIRARTHNLGMCPDWKLNPQSLGAQDNAPTKWPIWPGLFHIFLEHFHQHTNILLFLSLQNNESWLFVLPNYHSISLLLFSARLVEQLHIFIVFNSSHTILWTHSVILHHSTQNAHQSHQWAPCC